MANLADRLRIAFLYGLSNPNAGAFSGAASFEELLKIGGFDPAQPMYASLHTARPISLQTDSEVSYTGPYARQTLVRVTGDVAFQVDSFNYNTRNKNSISWPQATAGSVDARWVGFGPEPSGSANTPFLFGASPIMAIGGGWVQARCIDTGAAELVEVSTAHHALFPIVAGDEYVVLPNYNDGLPTPLSGSTPYFIKTGTVVVGAFGVTFQLATPTAGSAAVNFTSTLAFQMAKVVPLTIASPVIPTVPALAGYISIS